MRGTRLPFLENGWWVIYDHRIIQRNRTIIKIRSVVGRVLIIFSAVIFIYFSLPYINYFIKTSKISAGSPQKEFKPISNVFNLIIPKLSINVPVSANINPGERDVFQPYLEKGVAHATGTGLPGSGRNIFIFGHSSDYPWINNAYADIFLTLPTLTSGDKVYIHYKNNVYKYRVERQDIVNVDEISYLRPNNKENKLFLQTCWPPGTDWKRMIVTAVLDIGDPI